jgi:hypothetical protein
MTDESPGLEDPAGRMINKQQARTKGNNPFSEQEMHFEDAAHLEARSNIRAVARCSGGLPALRMTRTNNSTNGARGS